eukprot:6183266-Pleurochrysis_carterae.AAC.5
MRSRRPCAKLNALLIPTWICAEIASCTIWRSLVSSYSAEALYEYCRRKVGNQMWGRRQTRQRKEEEQNAKQGPGSLSRRSWCILLDGFRRLENALQFFVCCAEDNLLQHAWTWAATGSEPNAFGQKSDAGRAHTCMAKQEHNVLVQRASSAEKSIVYECIKELYFQAQLKRPRKVLPCKCIVCASTLERQ